MKIIANINWFVLLMLFSAIFFKSISGLNRSFDNNYYEFKNDDEGMFSDNTKILTTLLDSSEIKVDSFPFNSFTHIIVGQNRGKTSFNTHTVDVLIQNEDLELENLDLLLYIDLDKLEKSNYNLLDEAYRILDKLDNRFSTNQGLVFGLDASKLSIRNSLMELGEIISTKSKIYKNFLCLNYIKSNKLELEIIVDVQNILPNYAGQIIKTFHPYAKTGQLPLFDRMENLLLDIDLLTKKNPKILESTIFCFPTYPLIYAECKLNESTCSKKGKFLSLIERDLKVKDLKDEVNKKSKKNYLNYKYVEKNIPKTIYAFEDQETLESKIKFAAEVEINIGFWGYRSIIHKDKPNPQLNNPVLGLLQSAKKNPKSMGKKLNKKNNPLMDLVRKEVYVTPIKEKPNWKTPSTWYWQTLGKYIPKEKPPDYLLFLLVPLLVVKVLLPLFIIIYGYVINVYFGDKFLHPLKVELFSVVPMPISYLLWLEVLLWLILAWLFVWEFEIENSAYTTRNFSLLLLIIIMLGRPIIKFLIKLFKLFGKPFNIKKIIKLLPYLGEVIYYNITDEERKDAIKYIKKVDRNKDVYIDSNPKDDRNEIGDDDNLEYRRYQDYIEGREYIEYGNNDGEGNEQKDTKENGTNINNEGRSSLNISKRWIVFFKLLFVTVSIYLVWRFEYEESAMDSKYIIPLTIFIIELGIIYSFFKEYYSFYITKLFARNV